MELFFKEQLHVPVTITPALPEHAAAIYNLALSVKLPELPPQDAGKKGFLIFVPDEDEYRRRIVHSRHIFVATNEGGISGFITAFDQKERIALGREDDPAVCAAHNALGISDSIFMDQIAIAPKQGGFGTAQALLDHLFEHCPGELFTGAIVESPYRNDASIDFFVRRNGMKRISEVIKDGVTRGIYFVDKRKPV